MMRDNGKAKLVKLYDMCQPSFEVFGTLEGDMCHARKIYKYMLYRSKVMVYFLDSKQSARCRRLFGKQRLKWCSDFRHGMWHRISKDDSRTAWRVSHTKLLGRRMPFLHNSKHQVPQHSMKDHLSTVTSEEYQMVHRITSFKVMCLECKDASTEFHL